MWTVFLFLKRLEREPIKVNFPSAECQDSLLGSIKTSV